MKRSRRRYLLFHLHREGPSVNDKQLNMALWKSLLSLYGEIHAADSKLYLLDFNESSGAGVLQCNESALKQVITAAVVINTIEQTSVSFEPKKTSGTIKGLNHRVQKH
ncbi:MAG: Rpp14/Pop5 family protein [Candidatus Thorarchaeota archaeon]